MATSKEVEVWLSYLKETMNFESVFCEVFDRITHGRGHGVLILQGPSKIANKSFFLNIIKAFQRGVSLSSREYFSDNCQRLLDEITTSHYQCVDINKDCPPIHPNIYRLGLYMALPLSLVMASQKRGLKKGYKTVVLCDELHKFIHHNQESNIAFLKQLDDLLYNLEEVTFLSTYTLGEGQDLKHTVLSNNVLALGYD